MEINLAAHALIFILKNIVFFLKFQIVQMNK